jgi:hypothetical protein
VLIQVIEVAAAGRQLLLLSKGIHQQNSCVNRRRPLLRAELRVAEPRLSSSVAIILNESMTSM